VTSTVLLVQLLDRYSADVKMYIPNRFDEVMVSRWMRWGRVLRLEPALIITVDCGVRSIKEVEAAKEKGVKVIITDHHQPLDQLPQAEAVVCPRRKDDHYPEKNLAGVGIAYKLAEAVLKAYPLEGVSCDQWLDW
jgi:single-stranded-DNA-specific exonuclease